MALTPDQVKKKVFRDKGLTQKEWATKHGYHYEVVNRVLNGQSKATRGVGHEIALKLGLKDPV
jgi:gp16 family phage-associated protein